MVPPMTQAQLAAQLRVEANHVSRIERGLSNPPAKMRVALVEVLQRPAEYFVDEPLVAERTYHQLTRYPNAELAAEVARREGVAESAIVWVLSGQHNLAEDAHPTDWLRAMERREREERRDTSGRTETKQAHDQDVLDEREKEGAPKLPRRR